MGKYILQRSPRILLKENLIGYGWKDIDFSLFNSAELLIKHFKEKGVNYGRQRNQIKRYFNLSSGDIVLVPVQHAVAVCEVVGSKSYNHDAVKFGANRISVKPFMGDDGNIEYVKRAMLSEQLQRRLKIRQSVANLDEFRDELDRLVSALKNSNKYGYASYVDARDVVCMEEFKENLLNNIRDGRTGLASGGVGMERLVSHLLEIDGYKSKILSKSNGEGIIDVDIEATINDRFVNTKLYVQVKHHSGTEQLHGLRQLPSRGDDDAIVRVFITTANVPEHMYNYDPSIVIYDGMKFIDWLVDNVDKINDEFRRKLGIMNTPALMD